MTTNFILGTRACVKKMERKMSGTNKNKNKIEADDKGKM
jgi:hypothetical protein